MLAKRLLAIFLAAHAKRELGGSSRMLGSMTGSSSSFEERDQLLRRLLGALLGEEVPGG